MERRKTWFTACLTLLGLAVLSFSTCLDVSAYKFDINTIPLSFPSSATGENQYNVPSFTIITSDRDSSESATAINYDTYDRLGSSNLVFSSVIDENSGKCVFKNYTRLPLISSPSEGKVQAEFGFPGYSFLPPFEHNSCQDTYQPVPNFDVGSLPTQIPIFPLDSNQLHDLIPYRYRYSSFYAFDSNRENGFDYDVHFDVMSNLYSTVNAYKPSAVYDIYYPLGPSTVASSLLLTDNTPVEFTGEFVYVPMFKTTNFALDSANSFTITLERFYIDAGGWNSNESDPILCSVNYSLDDPSDEWSPIGVKYSCYDQPVRPVGMENSIVYYRMHVHHSYTAGKSGNIDMIIWDSDVVITDNDPSAPPSDMQWNAENSGNFTTSAPGSAHQGTPTEENTNFFTSLSNLFDFNLINPFTPLFAMFVDNSTCAYIPTIAGMIHSEETIVCPWFNSSTRNIVTPVLGIASVMLLFGFAVRWLGARSGNFFEDSTDETIGRHSSLNNGWGRRGKR